MSSSATPHPLQSARTGPLKGSVRVPGDKSISHRALMFGALAIGRTEITGLLEGEDVIATAGAMRAFGATVNRLGEGHWEVFGVGVGGLTEPDNVIDLGNSGTSARLLSGIAASHPVQTVFTGDASLRSRPMARVVTPLTQMGAEFHTRSGGRLPMAVRGAETAMPITYGLPVPSAQVKSAVLLAGLNAPGHTSVIEHEATRDHTENMLRHFGAEVAVEEQENGDRLITLVGQPDLKAAPVAVPTDPSSAGFPLVAALIVPDSEVRIEAMGLNPTRTGLLLTLQEMGGDITIENERTEGGEPVGDIIVRASQLKGITVPAERAPSMIDEYPVLAVAASVAEGTTHMTGLEELRVKESDRLSAVVAGLRANGVAVEEGEAEMTVTGGSVPGGGTVETHLDHRIAMAFSVLGMVAEAPVTVDDRGPIATSFPNYLDLITGLGASFD